jgi:hypothetical protein
MVVGRVSWTRFVMLEILVSEAVVVVMAKSTV